MYHRKRKRVGPQHMYSGHSHSSGCYIRTTPATHLCGLIIVRHDDHLQHLGYLRFTFASDRCNEKMCVWQAQEHSAQPAAQQHLISGGAAISSPTPHVKGGPAFREAFPPPRCLRAVHTAQSVWTRAILSLCSTWQRGYTSLLLISFLHCQCRALPSLVYLSRQLLQQQQRREPSWRTPP